MSKKILVTGGAGYIGSHVVKLLGEQGFEVVVFDNLSTGHREAVLHGELIVGELADQDAIRAVFKKHEIEAIIHFAGSIIVPESVEKPLMYYRNNVINTQNLLEVAREFKVGKFIFSSTAAVYGFEGDGFYTEESPKKPINPYGRSKLMIENMLEDLAFAQKDFHYIALRYFNVAGADLSGKIGQWSKVSTHLIKIALEAVTGKRKELQIFGTDYKTPDGTCVRDYIHVLDLASAHVLALQYLLKNPVSQVFNCGYGKGSSVREVIDVIKKVTGVDFPVREVGRRTGDPDFLVSVPDKIKEVLGWKPQYDDLNVIVKTAYDFEKKIS